MLESEKLIVSKVFIDKLCRVQNVQPFPSVLISLWSPGELTSWGTLQRDVDKDSDGDDDHDKDDDVCRYFDFIINSGKVPSSSMCFSPQNQQIECHIIIRFDKKKPLMLKMLIWVC